MAQNATDYFDFGLAFQKKDRSDEAIAAYRFVIKLQSDLVAARYNLVIAPVRKGLARVKYMQVKRPWHRQRTKASKDGDLCYQPRPRRAERQ